MGRLKAMDALSLALGLLLASCQKPEGSVLPNPSPVVQTSADMGQQLPITAQARMGNQIIQLEVAKTPQQQQMGLMYRPALPDDRGMLFPFDSPRPVRFWMKNVPVALDMVFLYQGKIQAIASQVPPCQADPCPTYGPEEPVDQVIELRAGRAAELNLQPGDVVTIQFLSPAL